VAALKAIDQVLDTASTLYQWQQIWMGNWTAMVTFVEKSRRLSSGQAKAVM
jgi:hypothetical protein